MIYVYGTKNGTSFFLLDQGLLRQDSAISTIIAVCIAFKQDAHFNPVTCFKYLHSLAAQLHTEYLAICMAHTTVIHDE